MVERAVHAMSAITTEKKRRRLQARFRAMEAVERLGMLPSTAGYGDQYAAAERYRREWQARGDQLATAKATLENAKRKRQLRAQSVVPSVLPAMSSYQRHPVVEARWKDASEADLSTEAHLALDAVKRGDPRAAWFWFEKSEHEWEIAGRVLPIACRCDGPDDAHEYIRLSLLRHKNQPAPRWQWNSRRRYGTRAEAKKKRRPTACECWICENAALFSKKGVYVGVRRSR